MATYVLVPGGWHGGWYFEPLARRLREHGHQAFPVTLTGVGDRHHLLTGAVNLDTHIQDVMAVLESERIEDAVLCGHSYAGMVISGVADRMPERVDSLVYCDAYVPDDGDSCWTLTSEPYRELFLAGSARTGYAVDPPERLGPRATSHPLASFVQSIRLTGSLDRFRRRDYVYLSDWTGSPFTALYERLSQDSAWRVHDIPVGHNVMASAADELAAILLDAAD
ncbi:alpha/beta fold hydrolase [Kutzneria sp. CA-103260]|uniref:alpha/beta fold hydrolase n=1 Tax=Kutzneria sp. CA-103260 TaxID=2802641 RepID=UPI001BA5AB92|nr:alpha/beta hydrolase [Kutzneria sp. CA-103260]